MTPKEYLSQAYNIDLRINAKMEQIQSLKDLMNRCSVVFSDMPRNTPDFSKSKTDRCTTEIITIEEEIKNEIIELIKVKAEISKVIYAVDHIDARTVLEKRYLSFKTWERIAVDLNFSTQHIHRLHRLGLKLVKIPDEKIA